MGKRASTNYSHIVAINKPFGLTSHDVVNKVRRIYGERRVGHTGTLDPAATGVLVVCVGPATRLDQFLTGHEKAYEFTIVFGAATDTDDAQGAIVSTAPVPPEVSNLEFAERFLAHMVGEHTQLPPAYSAIKVDGVKAYDAARAGKVIKLEPRNVTIYEARLVSLEHVEGLPVWRVFCRVSAGTYVRSLARDIGVKLGTCAHVGELQRSSCGTIDIRDCITLETLEQAPFEYLLDPVKLLRYRVLFAQDDRAKLAANGAQIPADDTQLFAYKEVDASYQMCSCSSGLRASMHAPVDGEYVSVVTDNRLKAIYAYRQDTHTYCSVCGFSIGVQRGGNI